MSQLMFSIRKLRKKRRNGAGYTLDIDSLDVLRGECIAITGPSGCGKSTALDLLAGILRPDGAERFIFAPDDDVAVDMMDAWDAGRLDKLSLLRRRYLGYVLQTGGLLPFLSARENITAVRRAIGLPDDTSVDALAERLGIDRLLPVAPYKLSVGERQRVAIARALASGPTLILADEPTAALDPVNAQGVMDLFADLAREMGCTVILVTHAPEMARRLGFREYRFRLASISAAEGGREGDAVRALLNAPAGGV
jgi:putative ABC transport system ATP-binding protein